MPKAKKGGEEKAKFKKAPQAPRRFKSAYMFYSTDKHKEIRLQLGDDKIATTEVAKMVSKAWKELPEDERQMFEDMAQRDKARYDLEKSLYTGPWKIPANSRRSKDPSAPKRPMSAFLAFSNGKRAMVKRQHPDAANTELSQILAKMWREKPEEERRHYVQREFELRQVYKREMAEWKRNEEEQHLVARDEREGAILEALDATSEHSSSLDGRCRPAHVAIKTLSSATSNNAAEAKAERSQVTRSSWAVARRRNQAERPLPHYAGTEPMISNDDAHDHAPHQHPAHYDQQSHDDREQFPPLSPACAFFDPPAWNPPKLDYDPNNPQYPNQGSYERERLYHEQAAMAHFSAGHHYPSYPYYNYYQGGAAPNGPPGSTSNEAPVLPSTWGDSMSHSQFSNQDGDEGLQHLRSSTAGTPAAGRYLAQHPLYGYDGGYSTASQSYNPYSYQYYPHHYHSQYASQDEGDQGYTAANQSNGPGSGDYHY